MPTIYSTWLSDRFSWQWQIDPPDELCLSIGFVGKLTRRTALQKARKRQAEGALPWLLYEKRRWQLDVERLRAAFPHEALDQRWRGRPRLEVELDDGRNGMDTPLTVVHFSCALADIQSRRIFLSHKGEDKKMVRRFQRALEAIGHEVWLDEKDLKAGDLLERGILQGFEESCAAVFFITDKFKDERYLKSEIDYAIAQQRARDEGFRIITLAFRRGRQRVEIPPLLKNYVWKSPLSELDALTEILKALPRE
jgi:hypothetical protein